MNNISPASFICFEAKTKGRIDLDPVCYVDVKRQTEGSHPLDAGSSRAVCSSPTQDTSPTASPRPTSPARQEVATSSPRSRGDAPPLSSSPPPAAPLLAAPLTMAGTESYVLHPPLPPLASGVSIVKQPTTSSVPLLLNPAVIHGTLNTPQVIVALFCSEAPLLQMSQAMKV